MNAPRLITNPEIEGRQVRPAEPVLLDTSEYAWIQESAIEVPVVTVTLAEGTEFQYGSLVGRNNSVRKIAGNVPENDSASAQDHLFMALPAVLRGDRHPGIGKVENSRSQDKMLLSASRNIVRAVRLIFAVEAEDPARLPVVLRAGISMPKDHDRLVRSLGVVQIGHGGSKKMRRT